LEKETAGMKRIIFTGPESTGKSTLAIHLAHHFSANYQVEYAREFLIQRNGVYKFEDLDSIAAVQEKRWSQAKNATIQFCDTDFLVLKIWSEYKFGKVSPFIAQGFANQQCAHYFLCYPDIPWEPDPLRVNEHERHELFQMYLTELEATNCSFTIVKGAFEERVEKCISIIEAIR
jgi:NadR type nicotinamide-nucleotide adenylyltransferase